RLQDVVHKVDAWRDVVDILEDVLLAESRHQAVVDASSKRGAVRAPIGDEEFGHATLLAPRGPPSAHPATPGLVSRRWGAGSAPGLWRQAAPLSAQRQHRKAGMLWQRTNRLCQRETVLQSAPECSRWAAMLRCG